MYDLVAFDFRGTGELLPFYCVWNVWWNNRGENDIRWSGDDSDTALQGLWEDARAHANNCETNPDTRDVAELIGTAFTARDLISVADALGEDGLLRYWGFGYGTVLGATVAAMFPHKIDKMILDAVVNPTNWFNSNV